MNKCSFCEVEVKSRLSKGLCHNCYMYFYIYKNSLFEKSKYANISYVEDKSNKQYGQIICHECGKVFVKLQQHIFYQHKMTKNEYCDKWGLDHKIQLTEALYHTKMSNYAYSYNMDKQLKEAGKDTQFSKGHSNFYKRSFQTKERLKSSFKRRNK